MRKLKTEFEGLMNYFVHLRILYIISGLVLWPRFFYFSSSLNHRAVCDSVHMNHIGFSFR